LGQNSVRLENRTCEQLHEEHEAIDGKNVYEWWDEGCAPGRFAAGDN
jgi:hypothetical protein